MKALSVQINAIATAVLNGQIDDLEPIRLYSNLTRTLAQTISAQATRSRFLKEAPDLRLDDEE